MFVELDKKKRISSSYTEENQDWDNFSYTDGALKLTNCLEKLSPMNGKKLVRFGKKHRIIGKSIKGTSLVKVDGR